MTGNDVRKEILNLSFIGQTAHIGSNLSCADMLATCYNYFDFNPANENRDIFILSKGHAVVAQYACMYLKGYLSQELYNSYNQHDSLMGEHPIHGCLGIEAATGSLGHGLPIACGIALANKIKNKEVNVVVVMSDGECQEGSNWEAIMFAAANNLDKVTILVDSNKWQATDRTEKISPVIVEKFRAFGWNVSEVNGHSVDKIESVLNIKVNKPKAIICHTIKGKGVSFMEDDNNWHYRKLTTAEHEKALKEIENYE